MQLFVFTYSLGDHIVMPVRDAIAMDLADEGKTGTFLGKYRGYATMGSMAASLLVFIGFRYGAFWFRAERKIVPSFCVSLVVVAAALFFLWRLRREVPALDVRKHDEKKKGLPLKKKYIPYYIVTVVSRNGCVWCLHRGSLSSSLRWGQIRWRFLESRRILAAV